MRDAVVLEPDIAKNKEKKEAQGKEGTHSLFVIEDNNPRKEGDNVTNQQDP